MDTQAALDPVLMSNVEVVVVSSACGFAALMAVALFRSRRSRFPSFRRFKIESSRKTCILHTLSNNNDRFEKEN